MIPLTSLVPREELMPAMPEHDQLREAYPELRQPFLDLLSLSTAAGQHRGASWLAALLPAARDGAARSSGYENSLPRRDRAVPRSLQFLTSATVKRSCVHFVTDEGQIIPFDTYNTFYRKGAEGAGVLARFRAGAGDFSA